MIYISHLKINYFAVINYPQILMADNNSSLILLMLHVHHRLAVALIHMSSVQDPDWLSSSYVSRILLSSWQKEREHRRISWRLLKLMLRICTWHFHSHFTGQVTWSSLRSRGSESRILPKEGSLGVLSPNTVFPHKYSVLPFSLSISWEV